MHEWQFFNTLLLSSIMTTVRSKRIHAGSRAAARSPSVAARSPAVRITRTDACDNLTLPRTACSRPGVDSNWRRTPLGSTTKHSTLTDSTSRRPVRRVNSCDRKRSYHLRSTTYFPRDTYAHVKLIGNGGGDRCDGRSSPSLNLRDRSSPSCTLR